MTRIENPDALTEVQKQILRIEQYLHGSELEPALLDLMRQRVSQINGCAYCLAMHAKDMLERGERDDRLHVLAAWRETDWFTDRERAALAWAESLTLIAGTGVPDDVFAEARAQFSEEELATLTLTVIAINGWNRINVAFHVQPTPFAVPVAA